MRPRLSASGPLPLGCPEKAAAYQPPDFGGDAGAGATWAGADAAGLPVVGPSPSGFFSGHPASASRAWTDNARRASFLMQASIAHVAQKTQLALPERARAKEKGSRRRDWG